MAVYSEHNWLPWDLVWFHGFWRESNNQRRFFDWLGQQIGIQKPIVKHLSGKSCY